MRAGVQDAVRLANDFVGRVAGEASELGVDVGDASFGIGLGDRSVQTQHLSLHVLVGERRGELGGFRLLLAQGYGERFLGTAGLRDERAHDPVVEERRDGGGQQRRP